MATVWSCFLFFIAAEREFWTRSPKQRYFFSTGTKIMEWWRICHLFACLRCSALLAVFLLDTNLGEVRQPARSWHWWALAAGRLLWSLCHPRCWRSCKSRKWRRSNTGHTGFGQTSYMGDNPAENNMNCEHTVRQKDQRQKEQKQEKKPGNFWCFTWKVLSDCWREIL